MQISAFLNCFRSQSYESLFSTECVNALTNIENKYGSQLSPKVIYEVELGSHSRTMDFSMQFLSDDPLIGDYWLEFDYDEYSDSRKMKPCVFYNAAAFAKTSEWWTDYRIHMGNYIGTDRAAKLESQLKKTVIALDGFCSSLFQIGTMDSRCETESVRIYTRDMSRSNVKQYLRALQWAGDYATTDQWMLHFEQIIARLGFTVSFDVMPDKISSKIGIEFTVPLSSATAHADISNVFQFLIEQGVCVPEKANDIIRWANAPAFQYEDHEIINMITHVKMLFDGEKPTKAKCYLGQIRKRSS